MESEFCLQEEEIINKEYYNDFANDVPMNCPICRNLVIEPYSCTNCQNSFCKVCISTWMSNQTECPFRCKDFTVIKNKLLEKILEKLKFKCRNGCGEEFNYSNAKQHYTKECPNLGKVTMQELSMIKKGINSLKKTIEVNQIDTKELNKTLDTSFEKMKALVVETAKIKKELLLLRKDSIMIKNKIEIEKGNQSVDADYSCYRWLCKACYCTLKAKDKLRYKRECSSGYGAFFDQQLNLGLNILLYEGYLDPIFKAEWNQIQWSDVKCEKCNSKMLVSNTRNILFGISGVNSNQNYNSPTYSYRWICKSCYNHLNQPRQYKIQTDREKKFEGYLDLAFQFEWACISWEDVRCDRCEDSMKRDDSNNNANINENNSVNNNQDNQGNQNSDFKWLCRNCYEDLNKPEKYRLQKSSNNEYEGFLDFSFREQWANVAWSDIRCQKCKEKMLVSNYRNLSYKWLCKYCYLDLGKPEKFQLEKSGNNKFEAYLDPSFKAEWERINSPEILCEKCKNSLKILEINEGSNTEFDYKWLCRNCFDELGKPEKYKLEQSLNGKYRGCLDQRFKNEWDLIDWCDVRCQKCNEKLLFSKYRHLDYKWICRNCYNALGKPEKYQYQADLNNQYEGYLDLQFKHEWDLISWNVVRCEECNGKMLAQKEECLIY